MIVVGLGAFGAVCFIVGFTVPHLIRHAWPERKKLAPWQIDPNQRCPGCGHADGSIKFSEELRNILHTCAICQATWGEETVVKVSDWRKGRPPQESPTAWP